MRRLGQIVDAHDYQNERVESKQNARLFGVLNRHGGAQRRDRAADEDPNQVFNPPLVERKRQKAAAGQRHDGDEIKYKRARRRRDKAHDKPRAQAQTQARRQDRQTSPRKLHHPKSALKPNRMSVSCAKSVKSLQA
jgi:hypothetical protein